MSPVDINSYLRKYNEKEIIHKLDTSILLSQKIFAFLQEKKSELISTVARLTGLAVVYNIWKDWRTRRAAEHQFVQVNAITGTLAQFKRERVFVDVTNAITQNFTSGVQRVARQYAQIAAMEGIGTPVFFRDGKLYCSRRGGYSLEEVTIRKSDSFIMSDATWNNVSECEAISKKVSALGGRNIIVLHDICPLLYPAMFDPLTTRRFAIWFEKVVLPCDVIVAVSQSTAAETTEYLARNYPRSVTKIAWNHLGADFDIFSPGRISRPVRSICLSQEPFFLTVGSLEPRKGLHIALDAMDQLWEEGSDFRYVIVGKYGWNAEGLKRRILSHELFGTKLFWLSDCDDAALRALYERAHRLVVPSVAEGFGLPIIEAARLGLHSIVSCIPVFQEIGDAAVTFFEPADVADLVRKLREHIECPQNQKVPQFITWSEATHNLFKIVKPCVKNEL